MQRLSFAILVLGLLLPPVIAIAETDAELRSDVNVLKPGEGRPLVAAQCGLCHSLTLVAQNRADREGWLALIRWMQNKHGLWALGELEGPILDYLETHYAPTVSGRRRPLADHLLPPGERTTAKDKPRKFTGN